MLSSKLRILSVSVIILLTSSLLTAAPSPIVVTSNLGPKPVKNVEGRVLIKFNRGVSAAQGQAIARAAGARLERVAYGNAFHIASVPPGAAFRVAEALSRNPRVEYAHPDMVAYAFATVPPNDTLYPYQWHLDNPVYGGIEMEDAWSLIGGGGNDSVTVAVLDSGILMPSSSSNPCGSTDFGGTAFVAGYDFINGDTDPTDDDGHGTHVAGTIAQTTNNGYGTAGIAYGVSLMPVKVLDANGSGSISSIAEGIYYAVDGGAKVINMSLGTDSHPRFLRAMEDAVVYAEQQGVLVVAATGNSGRNKISYPAAYPEVMAVGATSYREVRASYSNYGNGIDIVAPGGEQEEDLNGDGYYDMVLQETFDPSDPCGPYKFYFFSGTSMATPHVAGVAALLFSEGVATAAEVRQILQDSADDLGAAGYDTVYGHGLLNAYQALLAVGPSDQAPTATITSPNDGATVSGSVEVVATASDDDFVSQVEFFINSLDSANSIGTDTDGSNGWTATWDSTAYADGSHDIIAEATDSAGQTGGDLITVTVDNIDTPPSVSITSPEDGSTVGGVVTLEASASDDKGVDQVDFYIEGALLATDTSGSDGWTADWDTANYAETGYTLTATAMDTAGQTASASVSVVVNNTFSANVHVGDIDGSFNNEGSTWSTTITVTVHDGSHAPVAGASVSGTWGAAASGSVAGATNASGQISFNSPSVRKKEGSISFTVTGISNTSDAYDSSANHDPDGDSDGTTITVLK